MLTGTNPQKFAFNDIISTKEHYLEGQFGIRGYPAVYLLKNGSKYFYQGNRTVQDLKAFIKDGYLKAAVSNIPKLPAGGSQPSTATNTITASQHVSNMMDSPWFKVFIVATIFLAIGLFFLFRDYVKQNNNGVDIDENEDELEGKPQRRSGKKFSDEHEAEALDNSLESSRIGIEMTENNI